MSRTPWHRRYLVNRIIFIIVVSDFFLALASGFAAPVFSVFIVDQVIGGSLAVAGFATSLFWIVKSVAQFPISWIVDSVPGERDDYALMVAGGAVIAVANLLFYFVATEAWHIYLFEGLHGLGYALAVPAWYAVFTRHLDAGKEATEWTLDSNAAGLAIAVAAGIGGVVGDAFGPRSVFLLMAAAAVASTLLLLVVRRDFLPSRAVSGKSDGTPL